MELSQWLDLGRNLLLSGVLGAVVVGIYRVGKWHGSAEGKLDKVVHEVRGVRDEVKDFKHTNGGEHADIRSEQKSQREDFGNRLTCVETEIKTVCRTKGGPP